ncbi:MAG: 2OG-Fe(II) oxygenase [Planctomycetota bacterium]
MNFIECHDDALDAEFCREVIDTFENFPQTHTPGEIGSGVDQSKKNSIDCRISDYKEWTGINQRILNTTLDKLDEYIRRYPYLICGALAPTIQLPDGEVAEISPDNMDRIPPEQMRQIIFHMYRPGYLNMQKYLKGVGGYHHWHSEIYPREPNCETLHRVLLFMFFLNDVEDGGHTEFIYQQTSIAPKAGTMVIAPAGFTHTHKGNVPVSNDKYIVTSWILFQRAEHIFGQQKKS